MENRRLGEFVCIAVGCLTIACAGLCGAENGGSAVPVAFFCGDPAECVSATNTPQTCLASEAQFEAIGRKITDPELAPAYLPSYASSRNITVLPAVPAAISMVICGFLCISFVRDRRAWIAMLAGLLWLGQTGIHAVPELTHRFCARMANTANSGSGLDQSVLALLASDGETGNVESIRFIGLLRKLEGIPDYKNGVCAKQIRLQKDAADRLNGLHGWRGDAREGNGSLQAFVALVERSKSLLVCPAVAAEHFIVFSPAFIFSNLSRGPPVLTSNRSIKM